MTNEEIKIETEQLYVCIKNAQERLAEIRKICKHEKTYEGLYSYRIGAYSLSDICEYCGEWIRDVEI